MVTKVKNATNDINSENYFDALDLTDLARAYSFVDDELYKSESPEVILKNIFFYNDAAKITTPDEVDAFINLVLVMSALDSGNELLFENDLLKTKYAEYTGIDKSEHYADYRNNLSQAGKEKVKTALLNGGYKKLSDVEKRFDNLMLYHAIMNYAKNGGGHIPGIIEKFKDEYTAAGFDVSLLEKCPNVTTACLKLLNSGATSLEGLKNQFNTLFGVKGSSGSGGGAGGSGGYGGSGSGGSAGPAPQAKPGNTPLYVNPNEENREDNKEIGSPQYNGSYFKDAEGYSWANEAVNALYEKGVISGRGDDKYDFASDVTRAECIKLIVSALKVPDGGKTEGFSDVSGNEWYANYIYAAASAGITNGVDGKFMPDQSITRQDAAVMVARALGLEGEDNASFKDWDLIADYAKPAVAALNSKGIIKGFDGMFNPTSKLTRAEIAQLIYNIVLGEEIK